ncbi:MAG: hypothetical protein V3V20_08085 [Algisphaera sp.]
MDSVTSSPRNTPTRLRSSVQRARDAANRQAFRTQYRVRLRGRWRWILLSAALVSSLAAAIGWLSAKPTWRSIGSVSLAVEPRATSSDTHNSPSESPTSWAYAGFDEILERELDLLRRVGGSTSKAHRAADTLTRLQISVDAPNPDLARKGVAATLAAYHSQTQLNLEASAADHLAQDEKALNQRQADLAIDRQNDLRVSANKNNAESPSSRPADDELLWQAAHAAAETAQRRAAIATRHTQVLLDLDPPEISELVAFDDEARAWADRRSELDVLLQEAVQPPSPQTAELLREQALLEARLQARAGDTRLIPSQPAPAQGDFGPDTLRRVSLSSTLEETQRLENAAEQATKQLAALEPNLSAQRLRNAERDARAQTLRVEATTLAQRRESSGLGGGVVRLAVPESTASSTTQYPTFVAQDPRARRAAWVGLGGLLLGGFAPLLWFLSDRRIRQTGQGDLAGVEFPLLGTVPVMDGRPLPSGDTNTAVVDSIDAVRAVIEGRIASGESTFAVTGISPGSGTTSIAVGLSVSLALAGQRILLVDLSWLQKSPGNDDSDTAARQIGLGVDGVIADLGYLEDEDQERIALSNEPNADPALAGGFTGLLNGASLKQSVIATRLNHFSVLSALGQGETLRNRWTGRVSSKWLGQLMDVCHQAHYIVIIDAGSAAGSVEGMLACAAADGAMVVISSQEAQVDFIKAESRLRLVGAHLIGTILNRHGLKRLKTSNIDQRRVDAGGTRGSGLFAAAIENSRGEEGLHAALPRDLIETTPPQSSLGVDPVDEPDTHAQPTPPRQPPASVAPGATPTTSPLTGDAPAPDIHVVGDVMDQLVDHAIRSAQTKRRGPAPSPSKHKPS